MEKGLLYPRWKVN